MKTNKKLPQTDKVENRPKPAAIGLPPEQARQMVTQSSPFSHRTPGEIHSNGGAVWSESQGGSSLMKWNLGHENHSELFTESVGHQPTPTISAPSLSHNYDKPVSPVANFYINCHLIEPDNLQLYVPGLGETLLTCTLQFRKVWDLAHDNRQREAKPSQIVFLFQKKYFTAQLLPVVLLRIIESKYPKIPPNYRWQGTVMSEKLSVPQLFSF